MHRLFARLFHVPRLGPGTLFRRPWQSLLVLGISALVLALLSPFLWAGYHWAAGKSALRRYHNAEAHQHLNQCLKVWPWSRSVAAHLLAARAARRDGDIPDASQRLQEVQSTLGDQSPETLLEWALLHAASGDVEKVEKELQNWADRDPEQLPLILEALAEGYMHLSRVWDALRCVDGWLERDPDNVQALYLRSNILRQRGAWPKAAPDLRRIVELDPEYPGARWWLAVALVNIGYYEEAVRHLEVLRQRPPKEWDPDDILVRLAICRLRTGRNREARDLLDQVLARNPDHGLALLTRGQIDQMNGQLPEAEKWLRQAARIMRYSYKTNWTLTECLRQEGKTEEAQTQEAYTEWLKDRWERYSELTNRQLSERPNDPAIYCELGKLMLELGNPEGAKSWLFTALNLDQHCVPALTALADYYDKQGDAAAAEEYRRQAQEYAAQQAQARKAKN
jgi:tetratricopeptide (TPR) repeat protein